MKCDNCGNDHKMPENLQEIILWQERFQNDMRNILRNGMDEGTRIGLPVQAVSMVMIGILKYHAHGMQELVEQHSKDTPMGKHIEELLQQLNLAVMKVAHKAVKDTMEEHHD